MTAGFRRNGSGPSTSSSGHCRRTELLLVKPAAATLKGGQFLKLAVLVQDATEITQAPAGVIWSSSDAEVASVGAEGLVQAGRQGTADIVAYWNGMRGVASMTVLAAEAPETPCPSLSVAATGSSLEEATLCQGSTEGLRP